jgi:hypothetical protein
VHRYFTPAALVLCPDRRSTFLTSAWYLGIRDMSSTIAHSRSREALILDDVLH